MEPNARSSLAARGQDGEVRSLARRLVAAQEDGRQDPEAERRLCERLAPRIWRYGLRHLRSPQAAADLSQDVLIIVIEALRDGRLSDDAAVIRFVMATCRNLASSSVRVENRRRQILADRPDAEPWVREVPPSADLGRLRDCFGQLPGRERSLLTMTFGSEQGPAEIASALELSQGNVRVVRHRALLRLRECMESGEQGRAS